MLTKKYEQRTNKQKSKKGKITKIQKNKKSKNSKTQKNKKQKYLSKSTAQPLNSMV